MCNVTIWMNYILDYERFDVDVDAESVKVMFIVET